jgi:sulfonate transport system ATP-binding protein
VLLFDEPLSALDAFTRAGMQAEIEHIWQQRRFAAVFVTHDIEEAVFLGTRVAVMSPMPGRIQRVIEVDLPRPRQRSSPHFLNLCATNLAELHHEVAPASDYAI